MRKFCLEVGPLTPPCEACAEPQRSGAGSQSRNPPISYTVVAEIISASGISLATLTETISQEERTILIQEYVDFQITPPPLGEIAARATGGMNSGNYGYIVRRELDDRLADVVDAYRGSVVRDADGNPAQFPSLPPGTIVTVPDDAVVTVSSAYRNPRRNVAAESACTQTSHHMLSRALDLVPGDAVARISTPGGVVEVTLDVDRYLFSTLRQAALDSGNPVVRCERRGGASVPCDAPSTEGGQSIGKHVHVQW